MIFVIDGSKNTLRHSAGVLELRRDGRKMQEVPLTQLEQVVVYGNLLAEASAWRALAEAGVPTVLLSDRGHPQTAMIGGSLAARLPLRRLQHALAADAAKRLEMAKWFVEGKLQSYSISQHALATLWPASSNACAEFAGKVKAACFQAAAADSLQALMGVEGQVAQAWFSLMAECLPRNLGFQGRNRRPPRDPVNSLLSLSYTLLLSEVQQAVLAAGLDPSLGFLHQDYLGRESLALDFVELFRSGADCFVLGWLKDEEPDSSAFFHRKTDGCRMSKETRPLFFNAWAACRQRWLRPDWDEQKEDKPREGHVRELLNGRIARAWSHMKTLDSREL